MAAPCRLRTPPMLLLLCCSALAAAQSQTVWPPSSIPAVDPTTASTTLSRQFLSDEQHRLLTSPSFGQRITSRPRPAARPAAARRDWTPIWPGAQADGVGVEGGAVSAVTARPPRPSRRPDAAPPPSLAPSRPPVTEYYFASSVSPDAAAAVGDSGAGAEPTFPPAQLPTATFDGPATTPTRALPPGASRRPTATRLGLADRLSALVTSRPASTTIISPTRAAPEPPSSAALWTTTERPERRQTLAGLGLEPSTWSPERGDSEEPTAAPQPTAEDSGSSSSSSSSSGEDVSPTPVSPPCVVTPQHPGGYCRDGDILTVFTRDPTGAWAAYRTVQLPSSTVAALDGQGEGENTTQDPVGVTPPPEDRQTAPSTPAQDGGVTVTSAPEPEPTAASVSPLEEPAGDWESSRVESSSSVVVAGVGGGSGARDHLPSAGPPRPSVAGPTLPSDLSARDGAGQVTGDAVPESFPTATSAFPGPQPPTVAAPAAPAAADGGVTEAPSAASEAEKSGVEGGETVAPEEGKVTAPPPLGSTPTEPPPPTQPVTEPPTRGTTLETTGWTTSGITLRTTPQTTAWEEAETTVQEQTFPATLEAFTTSGAFTTAAIRAETTPEGPASTTPPPTWPPTTDSPSTLTPPPLSPNETTETAPPTAPGGFAVSGGEDWGTATSAAPLETTVLTLAPGSHPETTQHTSDKSAELGKVSISHPTRTSPVPGKTDDGFTTGTFHFTTAGTFDYPSGPTGFTSPAAAGITRRPTHFTTAGSAGFSTTAGRRPTTPGDYDYTTAPSGGNGGGNIGNGVSYGGGFPYGVSNYSTVGHGRLTPPPPPAFQPTTPSYGNTGYTTGFGTDYTNTDFSTDFSTPLGTRQPTETGFTSTRGPATTDATTPEITTPETTSYGTTTEGSTTGTTPGTSPSPGITHSSVVPPVEVYVQFLLGTTWPRFCRVRRAFKQRVVDLVNGDAHRNLTVDNAVLFNIPVCGRPVRARRQTSDPAASAILVFLYLTDVEGRYDREMTERVEPLWEAATPGSGHGGLEGSSGGVGGGGVGGSSGDTVARMVREVDTVRPEQLVQPQEHAERAGVIAAITVGCVAVASLVLLAVLLVVVRHRRRAAQTAQRCNPVNMEEYGVESVFSSMRRKNKLRRSVRSYLNQAFDDHDAPSNAVNFAGLANLSGDLAALKEEFDSIPTGAMPTLDDLPPGSEDRNRYANVLPVPETRVVLDQKTGAPNSDYINANYVRGPKDEPQFYIATQGPLESTVNDFWRMIWETQSKVVICLTDIVERGVRRCAEYLPPSEALDRHRLYGDFQVTLMTKTKKDKFVVSTIQLKNMDSNLFREVTHLWYSGWPERGVPSDLDSIVEFLQEARRAMKTNIGPTVVHCSPGTGRTGVLLACDICMRQFDASRTADIMRTVFRIRHDRAGAVQTREQYALIYKVLNQYAASVTSGNLPALE